MNTFTSVDSKGSYDAPKLCKRGAFVPGRSWRDSDAWVDNGVGHRRKSGSQLPHSKTNKYLGNMLLVLTRVVK
jgi:hypothetical protein